MKKTRSAGFMLVMTLLFILVFSMLLLSLLKELVFAYQLTDKIGERSEAFHELEETVFQLATTLPNAIPHCITT